MSIRERIQSPGVALYTTVFMVTQITGLLLSQVICFVLQDFTWGFVRVALINSFFLGLALLGACYLSRRLIAGMKVIYLLGVTLSLVVGIGIISLLIVLVLEPAVFIYYGRGAFAFILVNFLFIVALYAISSGLIVSRERMIEKEKALGREHYLKKQMEMRLLSSRVNPHFLFNTLNMLLTLLKQPAKAEAAILNLSDLLRHNLEQSDKPTIPLDEELQNVARYLEIQKLRFGEKLHYHIRGEGDFPIPPLILQPLVENSIKHNIRTTSRLSIDIVISRHAGRNSILIMDSARALRASMLNEGQGLSITSRRVESGNGTFTIKDGGIEISFSR